MIELCTLALCLIALALVLAIGAVVLYTVGALVGAGWSWGSNKAEERRKHEQG